VAITTAAAVTAGQFFWTKAMIASKLRAGAASDMVEYPRMKGCGMVEDLNCRRMRPPSHDACVRRVCWRGGGGGHLCVKELDKMVR